MNVVQERTSANTPTVAYTRGPDLSGALQGAGGIGGMLARTHGYSGGNWSTHSFYHADGMGNITYLVNSAQALAAKYKYDPYGRTITASGPLSTANLYRFSSKEIHPNSGLYYFGYRFYNPSLQRWMNRDPMGERGDLNLYRYTYAAPIAYIDPNGKWGIGVTVGGAGNLGVVGAGGGATGAVGGGYFWHGNFWEPSGGGWGAFAGGGAFARESPGVVSLQAPEYDQWPWGLGAYIGIGGGGFLTNVDKPSDLDGPFRQWNLNTPVGSITFARDAKGHWILSITRGPGAVGDISAFPTTTVTRSLGHADCGDAE